MANLDNPHGLNAVKMLNGGRIPMNKYTSSATTAIYQGDVVTLRANGLVATLKTTGGAENILGVAACYAAVSTDVWVYDHPETVFEIQSDGTTDPSTAAAALAIVGETGPLIVTAGNTTTKVSKHEIDYDAITTGTADPLQIIGYYQGVDNDNTLAHARFLVLLREHIWMGKQIGNVI
jgi:hypothetical protein